MSYTPHAADVTTVTVRCPSCGEPVEVGVRIAGIETDGLVLQRVTVRTGPVDHKCRGIRA